MRHVLIYIAAGAVCIAVAASIYMGSRPIPVADSPVDTQISVASTTSGGSTVRLAGQTVRVDVADTPASREQGLSGRMGLAPDEGMLFVFPADGVYAFWMNDMLFSIDILWLSASGTVVYMAENATPDSYPATYKPNTPARYVLELPAGWAKAHNLKIGDSAEL